MAKSGGVLNAICAKLLKGNLSPSDPSYTPRERGSGKGNCSPSNQNGLVDDELPLVESSPSRHHCEQDLDTDKENNNTSYKDLHSDTESAMFDTPGGSDTPVTPTVTPSSEGRRNRRKNVKPRNIVEYRDLGEEELGKDELDAFEINNRDVEFDDLYNVNELGEDEEEPAIDLSNTNQCDSFIVKETTQEFDSPDDCQDFDDDDGVLDLSVSRSDQEAQTIVNYAKTNTPKLSNEPAAGEITTLVTRKRPHLSGDGTKGMIAGKSGTRGRATCERGAGTSGDAAAIKDYAQSTVTELLGMYGLSDEAEDITQSVPLQNFSTRHILQHHPETQTAHQKHGQFNPKHLHNPSMSLASKCTVHLPHSAPRLQVASRSPRSEPVKLTPVSVSSTSPRTPSEGMYAKIVDSVAKMAKMPQGAMIDSRPLLPANMAASTYKMEAMTTEVAADRGAACRGRLTFDLTPLTPTSPSGKGSLVSKFATSAEYVKACFNPAIAPKLAAVAAAATGGKALLPDYSKYIKRFSSYDHCGGGQCRDMAYKEHFHCMDCNFRVFVKKEEMIRHFKWHKKRDESLQHGFMRYSPVDDCSKKFGTCTHNGRQTHYHCLQAGCNKVYISTSDVQMHANYHRKDSAIIQEGFQRFRATEDCGTQACSFYGQRTTHFHCRRPTCNFTFKNKADMEKHKAYHQKDELLGRDGFKKFMKYEHCKFQSCRYSKVANHIHCIRPGCEYVLHSTGQLYSHKRKHERRDFEHAYRRFKDEQKHKTNPSSAPAPPMIPNPALNPLLNMASATISMATSPGMMGRQVKQEAEYIDLEDLSKFDQSNVSSENSLGPTDLSLSSASSTATNPEVKAELNCSTTASTSDGVVSYSAPPGYDMRNEAHVKPVPGTLAKLASKLTSTSSLSDSLKLPITNSTEEKPSPDGAIDDQQSMDTDTGTQSAVSSVVAMSGSPGVAGFIPKTSPPVNEKKEKDESWKKFLTRYTANDPCHPRCHFLYKDHYHCNLEGCGMIFRNKDGVREHARYHEQQDRITMLSFRAYSASNNCVDGCQLSGRVLHYHCLWADCNTVIRTNDPPFSRLEHHKIHEYARAASSRQPRPFNIMKINDQLKRRRGRPPKYPKTEIPMVPKIEMSEMEIADELRRCTDGSQNTLLAGFKKFAEQEPCPDDKCVFIMKQHFHCVRPRCHHATDRADVLNLHAKDFHSYISILEGFEFFDRTVNCRRPHCHNNKANKHFHCVRTRCDYSFVRYSTMAQHDKKHKMAEMTKQLSQPQMPISTKAFSISPMILHNAVVTTNSPISIHPPPPRAVLQQGATPTDQDALQNIVKTAGTYFPLSALPGAGHATVVTSTTTAVSSANVSVTITPPGVIHAASNAPVLLSGSKTTNMVTIAPKPSEPGQEPEHGGEMMPLTRLLQQKSTQAVPQLNWLTLKMKMHYGVSQNCGRPFCKLKKKDHFHCFDCNQAFSEPSRLKVHVSKHGMKVDRADNIQGVLSMSSGPSTVSPTPITIAPISDEGDPDEESALSDNLENEEESDNTGDEFNASSSLNLDASTFTRLMESGAPEYDTSETGTETNLTESISHNILDLSVPPTGMPQGLTEEGSGEDDEEESDDGEDKEVGPGEDEENEELVMAVDCNGEEEEQKHGAEGDEEEVSDDNSNADPADSSSRGQSPTGSIEGSSRRSSRKRVATRHDDFVDSDVAVAKQRRLSGPKPSPLPTIKEEILPEGYEKFRFSLDCNQERCAYRMNLTHYHCLRPECRYAFSDRTRALQHTQKHERIDSITGDEFQQFRINQDCDRGDCEHSKKISHFHCLKCPFICTDTTKVLAHRRHHMKLDNISSKGFEKIAATAECAMEGCAYTLKQTHYHCLYPGCLHAVAGPAQMGPHQLKHVKS